MSAENIIKTNKQREAGAQFVRKHQKGSGGVGFCTPEADPLVTDTIEVTGKPFKKKTPEGTKIINPKSRIILLSDGTMDIISGGMGTGLSEEDANKILGKEDRLKLEKSLSTRKTK